MIRETVAYLKGLFPCHVHTTRSTSSTVSRPNRDYACRPQGRIRLRCRQVGPFLHHGGSQPAHIAESQDLAGAISMPLGIHCHNDSRPGCANSLCAVKAGAVHDHGNDKRCG
jgi:isopropylmalate/homocitrate/citramalate synthase